MENRLRQSLVILFILLSVALAPAEAFDIAVVKSADIRPYNEAVEGFREACRCSIREYVVIDPGSNILAEEVRRDNPEIIFVIGQEAFLQFSSVADKPIIYALVPDPSAPGHPVGRIFGVSMYLSPSRIISALHEVFPDARHIGMIFSAGRAESFVTGIREAAKSVGLEIISKKAHISADVPGLINSMKGKIDVFLMMPDAAFASRESLDFLYLFSFQNRVPVFTFSKKYVEMGAVAAVIVNPADMGGQAGEIARKLNSGSGLLPTVEAPSRTTFVINRKIARKLNIRLREDIIRRADVVD